MLNAMLNELRELLCAWVVLCYPMLLPKAHLPKFYEFLEKSWRRNFTDQMTAEKRADLEARGAAFLKAADT